MLAVCFDWLAVPSRERFAVTLGLCHTRKIPSTSGMAKSKSTTPSKTKDGSSEKPPKVKRKLKTHTALGVYKHPAKKTASKRQLAIERQKLEATIPVLNTIVPPVAGGRKRKGGIGKKGKVFVEDGDIDKYTRMIESASEGQDGVVRSKLEKAVSLLDSVSRRRISELTQDAGKARGYTRGPEKRGREARGDQKGKAGSGEGAGSTEIRWKGKGFRGQRCT